MTIERLDPARRRRRAAIHGDTVRPAGPFEAIEAAAAAGPA